jgi:hypothetical protein
MAASMRFLRQNNRKPRRVGKRKWGAIRLLQRYRQSLHMPARAAHSQNVCVISQYSVKDQKPAAL